ncbi:MAG: tyrosine-protein kinase family protein [Deltaproteobacteria bacterium]|nr:tyrosine-protein kinase family protein [Deltaproteobacteria bacterium]TLN03602.1 MAG: tyrosine-protein kinase family protein [bacterium]
MSRIEEALEKAVRFRNNRELEIKEKPLAVQAQRNASPIISYPQTGTPANLESPFLVTASDPHSATAEEYRKLKSVLVSLTRQQDEFRNTIMVTSSVSGEGKSVTALNLAISLAQEFDHTVLLIDADLRKPSLHEYFGLEPKLGLADCLQDGIDPGEVLIKTGIGKLTLFPAGKAVQNPVELISSQKLTELIQEMKHRYPDRYIIIDTPPVLLFAETFFLSTLVDGVVFIVREGLTSMQNITDALTALKGTPVLGMVYNDVNQSGSDNRYGYYYGRHLREDVPESPVPAKKQGYFGRLFKR